MQDQILFNLLADAALILDNKNSILDVNPAAEEFLGKSITILTKKKLSDMLVSDHPLFAMLAKVRKKKNFLRCHDFEIELIFRGRWCGTVDIMPLENETKTLLLFRKTSDAEIFEKSRNHSSLNQLLSSFPAAFIHEIRNPLSAVHGASQLLQRRLSGKDAELADLICSETGRIAGLVDQFDFSQITGLEKAESLNIHDVLDYVLRSTKEGASLENIEIQRDYDPSLPDLLGYKNKLIQLFSNLIKNAIDALEGREHPKITLSTGYFLGSEIAGNARKKQSYIDIRVIDNGKGIPKTIEQALFNPFVSDKGSDRGMGLAVASRIIEDHQGIITAKSETGITILRVLLPIIDQGLN